MLEEPIADEGGVLFASLRGVRQQQPHHENHREKYQQRFGGHGKVHLVEELPIDSEGRTEGYHHQREVLLGDQHPDGEERSGNGEAYVEPLFDEEEGA